MAAGITAVVCFALTIFALQTKWDFTIMGGALFVGVIILFVFGIVVAFIPGKAAHIAYASCGALLFSVSFITLGILKWFLWYCLVVLWLWHLYAKVTQLHFLSPCLSPELNGIDSEGRTRVMLVKHS